MNIIFLRGFNNYFNRVIKKYSTLTDYQSNSTAYVNFEGINFNPNDGVVTELVLGNESQKENNLPLDWENIGTPDYCVCYEMEGTPSAAVIKSRWFILESERLRSGQYRIALKRDVVAEHFNTIKSSPCFIEKGMVNDIENSLLYNKESMTYNQIKTNEFPLKDPTQCGWIVGYVAKDKPESATTVSTTVLLEGTPTEYITDDEVPGLTDLLGPGDNKIYRETQYSTIEFHIPTIYNYSVTNSSGTVGTSKSFNYVTFQMRSNRQIQDMFTYNSNSMVPQAAYQSGNTTGNISGESNLLASKKGTYYGYSEFYKIKPQYTSSANLMAYDSTVITTPSSGLSSQTNTHESVLKYSPSSLSTMNDHPAALNTYMRINGEITLTMSGYNVCSYSYSGSSISTVQDLNGKVIKLSDNKYYYITVNTLSPEVFLYANNTYISDFELDNTSSVTSGITKHVINSTLTNGAAAEFITRWKSYINGSINNYGNNNTAFYSKLYYTYNVVLSQISTETLLCNIPIYSGRNHTYDNSADLFAIPYGEIPFKTSSGGTSINTTYNRGLAIARAISTKFGDNACYDLQLVPYCPSLIVRDYIETNDYLPAYNLDATSLQYVYTGSIASGNECGFVLWCSTSKGTFDIDFTLDPNVGSDRDISNPLIYKLTNETQLCRLASPNFNGQFEFSLAKNNGVTKFNVDYTYKPYAPYIHVNPDFKFLYSHRPDGQDWNDAYGLICGGDFSLNFITTYWQTYVNNNKNFQQIFDRQIQNMDVNNAIALEKQEFQATVGAITSAIGGAMGGAAAGATAGSLAGPWGALAGGIVGGIGGGVGSYAASSYGAEKDKEWLQRQQAEARSFAIDMYGYQLGNIKAMPYSIKGTESLTNNNKIWPILELYNATDLEVDLLIEKIKYNGMTIMAVGNIKDYYTSPDFDKVFIKGQLIRLESDEINDDFHIADAIYQEINKGVYIPSGGL